MDKETRDEFAEVKELIRAVDVAVRGNGKEGLCTRVVKLEQIAKLLCWIAAAMSIPVFAQIGITIYKHMNH